MSDQSVTCPRCHRLVIRPTRNGFRVPYGVVEDVTATTITIRCVQRHPYANGRCGGRLLRRLADLLPAEARTAAA